MKRQDIRVNCSETHQTIEGFGCFGGRAKDLFQDEKRDDIIQDLFGSRGLGLSILRTEVLPSFSTKPGERNFDMDANLNIPPNNPYFNSSDQDEVNRRSQLWVLKNTCAYVKKIFATTWSPPFYMKKGKSLSRDYYDDFANYLADYVIVHQKSGIQFFGISPQNEPENVFSSWNTCFWSPWNTASFIEKNLKPIFIKRGLDTTKIIIGESANWSINNANLLIISLKMSKGIVNIVASHSYTVPNIFDHNRVTYNTNPIGNVPSVFKKTSCWITEACSIKPVDFSMKMGIQLAICLHKFLTLKNVNAYIFWLGMVRAKSNEALICSNGMGSYNLTKAFDVMGNYSRYIKEGYCRIATNSASLHKDIYVSAFKQPHSNNLSIVVINSNKSLAPIQLQLNGCSSVQTLTPYVTPQELDKRWEKSSSITISDGKFVTTLVPNSVTTFIS